MHIYAHYNLHSPTAHLQASPGLNSTATRSAPDGVHRIVSNGCDDQEFSVLIQIESSYSLSSRDSGTVAKVKDGLRGHLCSELHKRLSHFAMLALSSWQKRHSRK